MLEQLARADASKDASISDPRNNDPLSDILFVDELFSTYTPRPGETNFS
jgi:hypothetical protein